MMLAIGDVPAAEQVLPRGANHRERGQTFTLNLTAAAGRPPSQTGLVGPKSNTRGHWRAATMVRSFDGNESSVTAAHYPG